MTSPCICTCCRCFEVWKNAGWEALLCQVSSCIIRSTVKVCDNDAQSRESRPSMRESALLPVSTHIWTPSPTAPIKHLGQTAEGFKWSRCVHPCAYTACVHAVFLWCWRWRAHGNMSASVHIHFTSVHVFACTVQYIYADLLAPIDCAFASRVIEREEKKDEHVE